MDDDIPNSMSEEGNSIKWENGDSIDLLTWIDREGSYDLAVGYSELFWPKLEIKGKYLLRAGCTDEELADWEKATGSNPKAIEAVINHVHLSDIHMHDDTGLTDDKMIFLGNRLKEIYEAKLIWQVPDRPCVVNFDIPEDGEEYQITFWQKIWEDYQPPKFHFLR